MDPKPYEKMIVEKDDDTELYIMQPEDWPSMSEPGEIVFRLTRDPSTGKVTVEEGYNDGSCLHIQEGQGIEFFLKENVDFDELTEDGVYIMEGVTGWASPGDGWEIDHTEDWEWDSIKKTEDPEHLAYFEPLSLSP